MWKKLGWIQIQCFAWRIKIKTFYFNAKLIKLLLEILHYLKFINRSIKQKKATKKHGTTGFFERWENP